MWRNVVRSRTISLHVDTMPSTPPFSLRLAPKLKERLQKEAERSDRSLGYVAQKAIESYLDSKEEKRAAIRAALERADRGQFVPGEEVRAWIESWDTDNELPMPTVTKKPARRRT